MSTGLGFIYISLDRGKLELPGIAQSNLCCHTIDALLPGHHTPLIRKETHADMLPVDHVTESSQSMHHENIFQITFILMILSDDLYTACILFHNIVSFQ